MAKRRLSRQGKKAGTFEKRARKDGQSRFSPGKKHPSHFPWSDQPSFIKIMIGSFEEVLFIPPKFANNLVGVVNQCVHLEDSWGRLSKVKVSSVDGSLAFQEGWPDFVMNHSISIGEILIFKYVSRTLFLVQIFGTDACERISFVEEKCGNLSIPGSKIREDDYFVNAVKIEPENIPQNYHDYGSGNIVDVILTTGSPLSDTVNGQDLASDLLVPLSRSIQMVGMRGGQTLEVAETLLIPSEVVCKILITEEGVCHLINHDFVEKFTVRIATPTGLPSNELATCKSCNNIVPVGQYNSCSIAGGPDINCLSCKVDNLEDAPSNTVNGRALAGDLLVPLSTDEKGLAREQEQHNIQMLGTRGDQTPEAVETLLIPSEEVVCKFLITEEGVCHLINHDFEKKYTTSIMTPTGLASSELATCISCNNIVPMVQYTCHITSVLEVNSPSFKVDELEDEAGNFVCANEENGVAPKLPCLQRTEKIEKSKIVLL